MPTADPHVTDKDIARRFGLDHDPRRPAQARVRRRAIEAAVAPPGSVVLGRRCARQLGNGQTSLITVPVLARTDAWFSLNNATGIATGHLTSCATLADGGTQCWDTTPVFWATAPCRPRRCSAHKRLPILFRVSWARSMSRWFGGSATTTSARSATPSSAWGVIDLDMGDKHSCALNRTPAPGAGDAVPRANSATGRSIAPPRPSTSSVGRGHNKNGKLQ